ncbi:MAG: cupredoxin domain-containing protein [Thermomicrobiales bacterium]
MIRGTGRRSGALGAVATVAMLLLSACGNVSENAMTHDAITRVPEMSDAAAEATRTAGTPGAGGGGGAAVPAGEVAQEVTVAMHDIFFEPKEITIPANTNVKFILPNQGAAPHNFSIPDQDISVDVAPGETKDVVVNLPAGEYAFDCNVPGHKEAGMIGTLKVVEGAGGAAPAAAGTPAAGTEATPGAAGEEAPAAAATPGEAAAPAAAAEPVTIVSHDIYFEPKDVTIPANTDVTFVLPNEGVTMHNFSIPDLGVSVDIQPGETKEVVVNAPAGTYAFDCNVPGHKEAGMVGTLTVEEGAGAAAAPAAATAEQAAASPAAAEATPAEAAAPAAEAAAPASAEPVTVVSHDIYFDPKEITIPANTDVTFILPNEGVTLHNFSIPDLGVDVDIAPGETQEVVVNAPAGTYAFDCNVPGHKEAGMVGTLTVTESAAAPAAPAAATAEQAATPAAAAQAAEAATPAAETAAPAAAAEPVTVVSHDIFFDPKEISIPANTDVTFILPNEGVTMHNFSIPDLGIDVDINPGETKEVVVNAPAGTYEFDCNVPGHKAAGMVGTLTVTEGAGAAAADTAPAAATAEQASASPAAEATPAEEAAAPAAAEPVTVVSHDIFFDPKEITIPADTDVTVSLPNEGVTLHDFSIDELGISVSIDPGATEEVVINAPAGTYEYYCNVPGHKAAGMVGTLTVK